MNKMVGDGVRVLTGRDVPQQFHLGRECNPQWVRAQDPALPRKSMSAKPESALWTAPAIRGVVGDEVITTWSETYFRRGYDNELQANGGILQRVQAALKPERQWEVIPHDDARIAVLDSPEALHAAAARWPGEHGRISFEAMAADGIDGVWVTPDVIPDHWVSTYWDSVPQASLYAQFYGWEIESVAWLRSDNLTIGPPSKVGQANDLDRENNPRPGLNVGELEIRPSTREMAAGRQHDVALSAKLHSASFPQSPVSNGASDVAASRAIRPPARNSPVLER